MKNYLSAFLAAVLMGAASSARSQTTPFAITGNATPYGSGAFMNQTFGPPGGAYGLSQLSGFTDYGLTTNYGSVSGAFSAFKGCLEVNYLPAQGLTTANTTPAFNNNYTIEAWVWNGG